MPVRVAIVTLGSVDDPRGERTTESFLMEWSQVPAFLEEDIELYPETAMLTIRFVDEMATDSFEEMPAARDWGFTTGAVGEPARKLMEGQRVMDIDRYAGHGGPV